LRPLHPKKKKTIPYFPQIFYRETDRFFAPSGVQSAQSTSGFFHFRRAAFSSALKSKVGLALAKAAALRIVLNRKKKTMDLE
jgi:hypothetical protein